MALTLISCLSLSAMLTVFGAATSAEPTSPLEYAADIIGGYKQLCQCALNEISPTAIQQCIERGKNYAMDCAERGTPAVVECRQKFYAFMRECGFEDSCRATECLDKAVSQGFLAGKNATAETWNGTHIILAPLRKYKLNLSDYVKSIRDMVKDFCSCRNEDSNIEIVKCMTRGEDFLWKCTKQGEPFATKNCDEKTKVFHDQCKEKPDCHDRVCFNWAVELGIFGEGMQ